MIDSIYRKDENYYPKVFLEKCYFIEDIEIYCSNSDEEYSDEECINLFLETLENKKKYKKFFQSELLLLLKPGKLLPEL